MTAQSYIATLALLVSAATFAWKWWETKVSYLQMAMTADAVDRNTAIVQTSIQNNSSRAKRLSAVGLLIGPEHEHPTETFNRLQAAIGATDFACCELAFESALPTGPLSDADGLRQIIPLPYYTVENCEVGDETLTYTTSVDLSRAPVGAKLGIRMFAYGYRRNRRILDRKIQTLLIVPEGSTAPRPAPGEQAACPRSPECRGIRGCYTERPARKAVGRRLRRAMPLRISASGDR